MKVQFNLVVTNSGNVKVLKTAATGLKQSELAIKINLEIPDALFKRPELKADLTIPDDAITHGPINADVQEFVKDAISQATGLPVTISFVPQVQS